MPLRLPVVAAFLAAGLAGCMKTSVQRIARFEPARAEQVQRPAPAASTYKVKYAAVAGGEMKTVPRSKRLVGPGEPLGFRTAEDGTLLAVVGDEAFPLPVPADRVHHVVWYRRWKRPRQFVKEVGKVCEGAGYVAGKALEAGVSAALNGDSDDDDDCDDDDAGPWNWGGNSSDGGGGGHHHHHGGGGGGNHGGNSHGGGKPPKPGGDDKPEKPTRIGARNP